MSKYAELLQEAERELGRLRLSGLDLEGQQLPITKFFRRDNSLYAVPDWYNNGYYFASVMFRGLYHDYWYESADKSVLLTMEELSEEEMRQIDPSLVEAALLYVYNNSAIKYLLAWMYGLCTKAPTCQ